MGRRRAEQEEAIRKALLEYLDEKGDGATYQAIANEIKKRIDLLPSTATVGKVINEWRQQKGGER